MRRPPLSIVVLALGLVTFWAVTSAAASTPSASSTKANGAAPTASATKVHARAPSAPAAKPLPRFANPKRVLLVGDSLMVGAKDAISAQLATSGITTHFVGKEGTGLLTKQMWQIDLIKQEVATFDPDVVVIESCCNYATGPAVYYRLADGTLVRPDTQKMYQTWEVAARAAVRAASGRGAAVVWVVTPPASKTIYDGLIARRIDRFNAIYARLGVPLVNWRAALTVDGTYTPYLTIKGARVRLRTYDGLHITPAGDRRVASVTVAAVLGL